MITMRLFADTISNWIEQSILTTIPDSAMFMRGSIKTFADVIRLRPESLKTIVDTLGEEKFQFLKMFPIFKDDAVDSELLRTSLTSFFSMVKTIDVKKYIPNFSYNLTQAEIESLCRALLGAEGASSLIDGGIKNV